MKDDKELSHTGKIRSNGAANKFLNYKRMILVSILVIAGISCILLSNYGYKIIDQQNISFNLMKENNEKSIIAQRFTAQEH